MEARIRKFNIVALVLTILTIIFFIGTAFFGVYGLNSISKSGDDYQLGDGITSILMVLFFFISLIPTLCFAVGGIGFSIYPLKNKYHTTANIFKLVLNILAIVCCAIIILILGLRN